MRTEKQQASIVIRSTKDHQLELARKWGIPANVMASATFELGVTLLRDSGYTEEQIVELARQLVADLSGSGRSAS